MGRGDVALPQVPGYSLALFTRGGVLRLTEKEVGMSPQVSRTDSCESTGPSSNSLRSGGGVEWVGWGRGSLEDLPDSPRVLLISQQVAPKECYN